MPMITQRPSPGWHLDQPSERRALWLCALGALLGLVTAGAGLFTAQGTRIAGVPAEDVAIVNRVPILISDYIAQLRGLYEVSLSKATLDQRRKVLRDMIREELYVQRGIELGMETDVIEVRAALVAAVEGQQAIDAAAEQPSEAQLRSFYDAHLANYASEGRMLVSDYIAPSANEARDAVADLRQGRDVASVLKRYNLRDSGKMKDGEEFYFAAAIHLGDQLFAAARELQDGQVADPISTANGVHILVMMRNVSPVPTPYELTQAKVLDDWRTDKVTRLLAGEGQFLQKRADIQIAKGFE